MAQDLLKGKRGIIFGALDKYSIAWKVAEQAKEQGAIFTLSNTAIALRKGDIFQLAEKTESKVIEADVTSMNDLEKVFSESLDILDGKIDFVLHSIGMSPNVRKNLPYSELNYEYYQKTLDISALSLHKMLHTAMKMDAINEWGSVVALSYIAAQRTFGSYSDMAEAKAMLESIARSFGYHYGIRKKVRVNTVSQSPTYTTAGQGVPGIDSFHCYADVMSPLGNASALECAKYCISLFSDFTRMVTMQNLFHDGGFASMGMSEKMISETFSCPVDYFKKLQE